MTSGSEAPSDHTGRSGEAQPKDSELAANSVDVDAPHSSAERWRELLRRIQRPGTLIGGRFRVERALGAGGMGCVVLARNVELEQSVAVKMLLPGLAREGELVVRLLREARAAARLQSDHVVRVFDVTASGDFAPYIVMEYLEGHSLGERLRRSGPLAAEDAVGLVIQACEAVAEAHSLGIVHRDLKPENLFITSKPGRPNFVKVLDFGISKVESPEAAQITRSLALLGSPAYASPEQLRAPRDAAPQADIWALGVILYECTTGARPFEGETLSEICTQILHGATPRPRKLRADIPERLEKVILRCLEKDPAKRFASVSELVRELAPLAPAAAEAFFANSADLGSSSMQPEQRSNLSTATALWTDMRTRTGDGGSAMERPGIVALSVFVAVLSVGFGYLRWISPARTASAPLAAVTASATALPPSAAAPIPVASSPIAALASPPASALVPAPSAAPVSKPAKARPKPANASATGKPVSASTPVWVDSR
ncbi:MAG: protein kinase domain-containing protein [Myxococcota bacterium]